MTPPRPYNAISLEALASVLKKRAETATQETINVKGSKIAVLLGAGASVSAGVPLARDIVREIGRNYGQLVAKCKPNYAEYMAQLASADRSNLLRKYIDKAAVNAAHLYLAQLVKAGYVDRILTTNFDSLAVQALVLVNERPFIYDLANLKVFKPGQIASPAVIHLHGQFGGFVNLNTDEEFQKLGSLVHDVLLDTISQRALIIIGYGGLNDPVFQQLCQYGERYSEYDNGLYWISNQDAEPPDHVFKGLLQDTTKKAYYLRAYDADSFFMNLVRALECDLPRIVAQPFTFLKEAVRLIGNIKSNGEREDLISGTRKLIDFAIECHEKHHRCPLGIAQFEERRKARIEKDAQDIWQKGQVSNIEPVLARAQRLKIHKAVEWLAQTLEDGAEQLLKVARHQSVDESEAAVEQALSYFKRAEEIRPSSPKAHLLRAEALVFLAQDEEARNWKEFFTIAFDNFREATELELNCQIDREAYFTHDGGVVELDLDPPIPQHVPVGYLKWGEALESMATRLQGDERIAALEEAARRYQTAAGMQPDQKEALEKWFGVLLWKAQMEPYERSAITLKEAGQILKRGGAGFQEAQHERLKAASERLARSPIEERLVPGAGLEGQRVQVLARGVVGSPGSHWSS